jgi:hypothetical protein
MIAEHILGRVPLGLAARDALRPRPRADATPACYRRGEGDKREFWIEPLVWTEELCGDEINPRAAARTLLGLLRTQDAATNCCPGIGRPAKSKSKPFGRIRGGPKSGT